MLKVLSKILPIYIFICFLTSCELFNSRDEIDTNMHNISFELSYFPKEYDEYYVRIVTYNLDDDENFFRNDIGVFSNKLNTSISVDKSHNRYNVFLYLNSTSSEPIYVSNGVINTSNSNVCHYWLNYFDIYYNNEINFAISSNMVKEINLDSTGNENFNNSPVVIYKIKNITNSYGSLSISIIAGNVSYMVGNNISELSTTPIKLTTSEIYIPLLSDESEKFILIRPTDYNEKNPLLSYETKKNIIKELNISDEGISSFSEQNETIYMINNNTNKNSELYLNKVNHKDIVYYLSDSLDILNNTIRGYKTDYTSPGSAYFNYGTFINGTYINGGYTIGYDLGTYLPTYGFKTDFKPNEKKYLFIRPKNINDLDSSFYYRFKNNHEELELKSSEFVNGNYSSEFSINDVVNRTIKIDNDSMLGGKLVFSDLDGELIVDSKNTYSYLRDSKIISDKTEYDISGLEDFELFIRSSYNNSATKFKLSFKKNYDTKLLNDNLNDLCYIGRDKLACLNNERLIILNSIDMSIINSFSINNIGKNYIYFKSNSDKLYIYSNESNQIYIYSIETNEIINKKLSHKIKDIKSKENYLYILDSEKLQIINKNTFNIESEITVNGAKIFPPKQSNYIYIYTDYGLIYKYFIEPSQITEVMNNKVLHHSSANHISLNIYNDMYLITENMNTFYIDMNTLQIIKSTSIGKRLFKPIVSENNENIFSTYNDSHDYNLSDFLSLEAGNLNNVIKEIKIPRITYSSILSEDYDSKMIYIYLEDYFNNNEPYILTVPY